jgi:formiminotetrahydrofolate cyclodeaminase
MTSQTRGLAEFVTALAAKQPTPGGGGAACVAGAIGIAAARMSAAYTTRKKDVESGAATHAQELIAQLDDFAKMALAEAEPHR